MNALRTIALVIAAFGLASSGCAEQPGKPKDDDKKGDKDKKKDAEKDEKKAGKKADKKE